MAFNTKISLTNDKVCQADAGVDITGAAKLLSTPAAGAISDAVLVWNSSDKIIKQVAGSSLGDKNNIYSKTTVTTNTTLDANSPYLILVNHGAAVTITLPTTPTDGQAFKIKDASASGGALAWNITIARNTKLIDGEGADVLINTDGGAIELAYDTGLGSWYTLSFVN